MSGIARRTALLGLLALSGCASSLSGIGGTQDYACKAPIGSLCTSVSGVYANALHRMAQVPRPPQTESPQIAQGENPKSNTHPPPFGAIRPVIPMSAAPAAKPIAPLTTLPSFLAAPHPSVSAPITPEPLRTNPRLLRLWIAPWEDADGDLHDAAVVHVIVDTGRWLIERVRPLRRSRLDRVTPPMTPATPSPSPSDATTPSAQSPVSASEALPGTDALRVEP